MYSCLSPAPTHMAPAEDYIVHDDVMSKFIGILVACMQAGCPIGKDFIRVMSCNQQVGGGFQPKEGVCRN